MTNDPDDCVFPNVNMETRFGNELETTCRIPIMTGALGSTFIAARYWDSFAVGAALRGIPYMLEAQDESDKSILNAWECPRINFLTQNVNVSGPSNAPDAGKALVSGRVQADRIGTRDPYRHGRKGPVGRALPASRDVRLTG
jgi:hypothetical protein